jgi:hypothetical protein
MKIIFLKHLKSTRARPSRNLEAARKVLGKTHSKRSSKELEDDSRSNQKSALLSYEESGGLSGIDPQVPARKLFARKKKSVSY